MKKSLSTFTALLFMMALPLVAHAQGKLGVININAAIAGSEEGKKVIADLQKKYQPRQQEIERLQQEAQSDQDRLTKQASTLSADEQGRLSRDLEDKQRLLKRATDDAQTDFAADRDGAVRRIGQKMVQVISDYAEHNGFNLVLDGAQVPIYYAAKGVDITPEIVKRYDAANPVAGGATPAKPAAKPAVRPVAGSAATKPK